MAGLAPASFRLHRAHPDLFPRSLLHTQVSIHAATFLLGGLVALGVTGLYVAGLLALLLHGAIAFVRLLFFGADRSD